MHVLTMLLVLLMMFSSRQTVPTQAMFSELPLKKIQLVDFSMASGGASNHNYFLKTKKDKMFLRVGSDTEAIAREAAIAALVADAGIAPELITYSEEKRIIATRMVENLSDFSLREVKKMEEIACLVRKLHESDICFNDTVAPVDLIKALIVEAKQLDVVLPPTFNTHLEQFMTQLSPFDPSEARACHLDLHKGNFLYDKNRFWIIDWEYAANSDPLFDLAVLSATENFSDNEMLQLLTTYGKPEQFNKLYQLRMIADARWAIWCLVRGKNATIDFPYEKEAERYIGSFLARVSSVESIL